jgi:hypothetical protein
MKFDRTRLLAIFANAIMWLRAHAHTTYSDSAGAATPTESVTRWELATE